MKIGRLNIQSLYILEKKDIVKVFLYGGMLLAYFGSLNPWFLWSLGPLYIIPAGGMIAVAMLISNSMERPVFHLRNFLPAILCYVAFLYYQLFLDGANIIGFAGQSFSILIFLALFRVDSGDLLALVTFIAKAMAILLSVSIPCFFLHLLGFPFPSRNDVFGEYALYSYTNYYFFMIDDRSLLATIFPRFHSVFLEPGHLGTATVLLLLTQIGKWKKWYNIVLIVATLMTFSLAAYVLFVVTVFLNLWCQRKNVFKKLVASVFVIAVISIGAFFYNGGDNLIHDLILIRLEVEDGELAGDNRVTNDFQAEYEDFLQSSDLLLGREMDKTTSGNSGFRVFIYENGLIGLALVMMLYSTAFWRATDKRMLMAAVLISVLCFIVRGYPLWYNYFIPLLCTACLDFTDVHEVDDAAGAEAVGQYCK